MKKEKKRYTAEFKARVALEAIRGRIPMSELARKFDLHVSLIHTWKRLVLEAAPKIMEKGGKLASAEDDLRRAKEREVERLSMENEWLQKVLQRLSASERRAAVVNGDARLPLIRQVKLLNINRSAVYYQRKQIVGEERRVAN